MTVRVAQDPKRLVVLHLETPVGDLAKKLRYLDIEFFIKDGLGPIGGCGLRF